MEQTKGLDELTRLAVPALRHAELVALAREHSPSKAQELASGRWPRRQARACRFLAMVRRDYPEAFVGLVNNHPSEHAHPNGSDGARSRRSSDSADRSR